MKSNKGYYLSAIGTIEVVGSDDEITSVQFVEENPVNPNSCSDIIQRCILQLDEYFKGKRVGFDNLFQLNGTEFQKEIFRGLLKIPFGKTISYSELARRIDRPDAVRAVGNVNSKNSILLLLPCHRVVGSNGALVGYAGGLWRKKWLLEHEAKLTGLGEQATLRF